MFDWYKPVWKRCPECFETLSGWRGDDGPGNQLFWEQHAKAPRDQRMDDELCLSSTTREALRLPETFVLSTQCENCETFIKAEGHCVDSVWRYTFIRQPEVPYPSGEEHLIFGLNIMLQDLAKRIGKEIVVFEEDGLGTFRAIDMKTSFGASFVLKQSDYQVDKSIHGDRAFKGPVVYVDGYDAIKFGYLKMYWGILEALNLSEVYLDRTYPEPDDWVDDIRQIFESSWRYYESKLG